MNAHTMWSVVGPWLLASLLALPSPAAVAESGAPTQVCRSMKLEAAGHYYLCQVRAEDDVAERERCDAQFARAFERADRIGTGCEPWSLDRTRNALKGHVLALLSGEASPPPCGRIRAEGALVTCWLLLPRTTGTLYPPISSVNLQSLIDQIQAVAADQCAPCAEVTRDTILWLQAWGGGGNGMQGNGFAQTITTVADLMASGIQDLHFYIGSNAVYNGTAGGAGAAATIVTRQDLTLAPDQEPELGPVLLIAGGSGGWGGENDACQLGSPAQGAGGAGGLAISTTANYATGRGGDGGRGGGQGGDQGFGGSGVYGGHGLDGTGGRGGLGGEGAQGYVVNTNPSWLNAQPQLTFSAGQGQGGGGGGGATCTQGGGGGGGGWGGGGGGPNGNVVDHPGGGGGGGSLAFYSTRSDGDAPTTRQPVPLDNDPDYWWANGGFVQLVFNTDPS